MSNCKLHVACNVVCGHGGSVVGAARTAGRSRPSGVFLSRTHSRSGYDLWSQRRSAIRSRRICLFGFSALRPGLQFLRIEYACARRTFLVPYGGFNRCKVRGGTAFSFRESLIAAPRLTFAKQFGCRWPARLILEACTGWVWQPRRDGHPS
jgi:hypothetical protein